MTPTIETILSYRSNRKFTDQVIEASQFESIGQTGILTGYSLTIMLMEANLIILQDKGKHFDPEVVDAFLAIEDEFKAIAAYYQDIKKVS